jgi:hypothetical protein
MTVTRQQRGAGGDQRQVRTSNVLSLKEVPWVGGTAGDHRQAPTAGKSSGAVILPVSGRDISASVRAEA